MVELGQLESQAEEFAKRGVRVIAVSIEGPDEARATQADFPSLVIVSDQDRSLAEAVAVIHPDSNPHGGDTAAPTTLLLDGTGTVRWLYRPDRVFTRLSPAAFLAAIDREMPLQPDP